MASLSSLPSLSSFPSLASLPAFPSLPTLDRIQIPSSTSSLGLAAVGGLVSYLALVRGLRYRQREQLAKQFGYHGMSEAEIYEKLTLDHAQEIMKALENREFPFMFNTSLQFALFRVHITVVPVYLVTTDNKTRPMPSPPSPGSSKAPNSSLRHPMLAAAMPTLSFSLPSSPPTPLIRSVGPPPSPV